MKELPKDMTIGECYQPAMEMHTQKEADEYFEALVQRDMNHFGQTRENAESVTRKNLGYFAGYYDHETRVRVERLFKCAHPIFGHANEGAPSLEKAFDEGLKRAQA